MRQVANNADDVDSPYVCEKWVRACYRVGYSIFDKNEVLANGAEAVADASYREFASSSAVFRAAKHVIAGYFRKYALARDRQYSDSMEEQRNSFKFIYFYERVFRRVVELTVDADELNVARSLSPMQWVTSQNAFTGMLEEEFDKDLGPRHVRAGERFPFSKEPLAALEQHRRDDVEESDVFFGVRSVLEGQQRDVETAVLGALVQHELEYAKLFSRAAVPRTELADKLARQENAADAGGIEHFEKERPRGRTPTHFRLRTGARCGCSQRCCLL